jgi:hypothetical protein
MFKVIRTRSAAARRCPATRPFTRTSRSPTVSSAATATRSPRSISPACARLSSSRRMSAGRSPSPRSTRRSPARRACDAIPCPARWRPLHDHHRPPR